MQQYHQERKNMKILSTFMSCTVFTLFRESSCFFFSLSLWHCCIYGVLFFQLYIYVDLFCLRFRKKWLELPEFHGWLAEASVPEKAICTACNKELTSGKSELLRHASGKKHKEKIANGHGNLTVPPNLSSVVDEKGIPHVLVW